MEKKPRYEMKLSSLLRSTNSAVSLEIKKYTRQNVLLHLQCNKESMSSTFYVSVFVQKCFAQLFSSSFWLCRKDFGKKALSYENCTRKMLMKLTKDNDQFITIATATMQKG